MANANFGIPKDFLDPVDPNKTIAGNTMVPVYVVEGPGIDSETVQLIYPRTGTGETVSMRRLVNQTEDLKRREVVGIALKKRDKVVGFRIKVKNDLGNKALMIDSCLKANREWIQSLSRDQKRNLLAHCKDLNQRIVSSLEKNALRKQEVIAQYDLLKGTSPLSNGNKIVAISGNLTHQSDGWKDMGAMISSVTGITFGLVDIHALEEMMEAPAAAPMAAAAEAIPEQVPPLEDVSQSPLLPMFDQFMAILGEQPQTVGTLDKFEEMLGNLKNASDLPKFREFFESKTAHPMIAQLIDRIGQIEAERSIS